MQYRVYANHKKYGWLLVTTVYSVEDTEMVMNDLQNKEDIYSIFVVSHDLERDEDIPYARRLGRSDIN